MDKEPLSRADFRQLSGETGKKEINRNYIILRFVDFTCLPDEITSLLALEPSRTGIKGEEIVNRWGNPNKRLHEYNLWEYEWKNESNDFISDFADKFVKEIIEPNTGNIKNIPGEAFSILQVVQYYYSSHNPGYHFSADIVKILAEASIEIDIDTYCLREE